MSLGEKERLLRLEERFDALDQDQQQQLRRLHKAIQADRRRPATPSSHAPLLRVVEDVAALHADGTGGTGAGRSCRSRSRSS